MAESRTPTRVQIVATPDSSVSPIIGIYEALRAVDGVIDPEDARPSGSAFEPEIVGPVAGPIETASGLPLIAGRGVAEVEESDVVVVPSMRWSSAIDWRTGRYPQLVAWIQRMHDGGATICAACTGTELVAETGLLDEQPATIHWASEHTFRRRHPAIDVRPHEVLVVAGAGGRIVTSGAATAWHDLVLYLVARHVGPATAQALARFLLWEWHRDGQAAFGVFSPPFDHGDAAVLAAQRRIAESYAIAAPVEEMARWSGLAPRTFKRRFKLATGYSAIAYVQRVRIERAKRLLETGSESVEDVSWAVGYEDAASFRRLFKRLTGLTPGAYRQRFRVPPLATARD